MRLLAVVLLVLAMNRYARTEPVNPPGVRELPWETYLDKVQGAWMGKMIGVTFGQPWEFQYQNTPIGFDITDWPLSPTRMKNYRARAANRPDQENWDPITREADNQKVVILHSFIMASEKEHPSFGAPDNDDIYINLLFLYCLRRYGIDVDPVTVAHEWDAKIRHVWHANDAGLKNIRKGILPPDSGNPRYNPHADDIDFQIESDVFRDDRSGDAASLQPLWRAHGPHHELRRRRVRRHVHLRHVYPGILREGYS